MPMILIDRLSIAVRYCKLFVITMSITIFIIATDVNKIQEQTMIMNLLMSKIMTLMIIIINR